MQPIQLFELASRQAQWLAARQNVVAGNIANVNTPGYNARDVQPFDTVLNQTNSMRMAATNPRHFTESPMAADVIETSDMDASEVKVSGNSVSVEDELMKSGQIKRDYELNAGLVKAFHRMMLLTLRK
ncbi:flagellar basal body rod protein FlgB [Rhizobium sp. SG2393]|uniref:flagellar basal body rod protein FlgB n=1 Tax=Rhizobium sp. SG2393 TaxID=3276279 RepID=UPI00366EE13B